MQLATLEWEAGQIDTALCRATVQYLKFLEMYLVRRGRQVEMLTRRCVAQRLFAPTPFAPTPFAQRWAWLPPPHPPWSLCRSRG
jgi:hypothetical protein